MLSSPDIINARREASLAAYNAAKAENHRAFLEGDHKATAEYIFPNQIADAHAIVDDLMYSRKRRVVSIQKKTKVGADGLMIEIAKLFTTHNDDSFVVDPANVRIITGMSNASWEKDMKDKVPNCFKNCIFHHGKLSRANLNISNGLIIIDEIDTGDKELQRLHTTLESAGVLDIVHMNEHNNRFVFISATMIKQLYDLDKWGDIHELYKMTIPASYFGHKDFLDRGIIKEFYNLNTTESANKWVQEDIVDRYGNDYRVHIVRVNKRIEPYVQKACIDQDRVIFKNHNASDRLSEDEITVFFKNPLQNHIVLGVRGFYRRANLIPNAWKLRIGATHELCTTTIDNNVQIQGLVGRMTGYWRDAIDGGHITGPYRTSIKAIHEYENTYEDPFGLNYYQTNGFVKRDQYVNATATMLSAKNIKNLQVVETPVRQNAADPKTVPIVLSITPEDMDHLVQTKTGRLWNVDATLKIIKKYSEDTWMKIKDMQRSQITCPESQISYDKNITPLIKASISGTKYTWAKGDRNADNYQVIIDKRDPKPKIIISIYYGSRVHPGPT
jgi:hypothetical protein